MSSPERRLRITRRARRDIDDILAYTLNTWGPEPLAEYRAAIDQAIFDLVDFPEIGRRRDEIMAGIRTRRVRGHVLVYVLQPSQIVILRVVHERRDLHLALSER